MEPGKQNNMTHEPRDLSGLRDALEAWAKVALPSFGPIRITGIAPADGGMSSETYLVDATGDAAQSWVLRIEPRNNQVYEDPSVARQFRMIGALARQPDLPVPAAIAFEGDERLLGAPFFLMERASGVAPPAGYHSDGLFAEHAPAEREAMWLRSIALMARLHALDPAPFQFLAYGDDSAEDDGIAQELARWDSYRDWIALPAYAPLDRARRQIEDERPRQGGIGVAWGDARPCNLLYRDGQCAAMLDWETASLGGAETDLGWWIFYDELIAEAQGVRRLDGIGGRDATIAAWEGFAGRKAVAMEWHILFAAYRFALISQRAVALSVAAGRLPKTTGPRDNPAVRRLEQLMA